MLTLNILISILEKSNYHIQITANTYHQRSFSDEYTSFPQAKTVPSVPSHLLLLPQLPIQCCISPLMVPSAKAQECPISPSFFLFFFFCLLIFYVPGSTTSSSAEFTQQTGWASSLTKICLTCLIFNRPWLFQNRAST